MPHKAVTDYLGHPCKFTEAKEYFSPPFEAAQTLEKRQIKRMVSAMLLELNARINHSHNASEAICKLAESVDHDDGQLHALLVMLSEHELSIANNFFDLAGYVLAGLDDGPAVVAGRLEP
jgi:hypothetical protein